MSYVMQTMRSKSLAPGFSLIELMLVLTIIGLLMRFAMPGYSSGITRSYRHLAQSDLMALAAALEQYRSVRMSYAGAIVDAAESGPPAIFQHYSPSQEPEAGKRYELSVSLLQAGEVLLMASPVPGTAQQADGVLLYYLDGRRAWDRNNDDTIDIEEYCWQC